MANIKELFTGGQKVKEARAVVGELGHRATVPRNDRKRLEEARGITRRHFLKLGVAGLGVATVAGLGLWKIPELLGNLESDDEVRSSYEEAFRKLATGDPHGEELINFYDEAARKAHYRGENIISDEEGTRGKNFWVAVVSQDTRLPSFQVFGLSKYDPIQDILTIKRIRLSEIWKGALFAHEVSHAYDDIIKLEERTQRAFDLGEVVAYDFELHLLDRTTGGQLKDRFKKQAGTISEGRLRGMLTSQDFAAFDAFFPNALNREEENLRNVVYTIGINFAAIESRYNIPEEIKQQKMSFIGSIFEGPMPTPPIR